MRGEKKANVNENSSVDDALTVIRCITNIFQQSLQRVDLSREIRYYIHRKARLKRQVRFRAKLDSHSTPIFFLVAVYREVHQDV